LTRRHRRIYEKHYGSIPDGYHVHHIDGNHKNNDPTNLVAISIQEHYDIHKKQGDYGACWALIKTGHLVLTSEERSEISRLQLQSQWDNHRDKMMNARRNRDDSCLVGRTWKLSAENAAKVKSNLIPNSMSANLCTNTIWINNGVKNKRLKNHNQIPDGYVKGRLFIPWNKKKEAK